jgi:hypothetical protein
MEVYIDFQWPLGNERRRLLLENTLQLDDV